MIVRIDESRENGCAGKMYLKRIGLVLFTGCFDRYNLLSRNSDINRITRYLPVSRYSAAYLFFKCKPYIMGIPMKRL